jgi:hypothetical protein
MKRVLMIPSFSMRSYTRDKWLLSRDAHATQAMAMAKHLVKDYIVHVIVPEKNDLERGMFRGCKLLKVWDYGRNIAEAREKTAWTTQLSSTPYDFIFCGHPEYVELLRLRYPEANIATILTHGPLAKVEYLRSVETAMDQSDTIFYNFARSLLPEDFRAHNVMKLFPLISYADADRIQRARALKDMGSIVFLSRLTDKDRFDTCFWMSQLGRLAEKHRVTLTDPSEGSPEVVPGTRIEVQQTKERYFQLLDKTDIVIIPYNIELTISVSYFEALAMGCKVLTQRCSRHFKDLNTSYSLNSSETAHTLDEKIAMPYRDGPLLWAESQRCYIDEAWVQRFAHDFIERRPHAGTN